MAKLIYPELSYKLIGIAYKVFNELGPGYQEKIYKKAYELELRKQNISYEKERRVSLKYDGKDVGDYFLDFLIEGRVVLEFKVANFFHARDIKQTLAYLKSNDLKLGILIICKSDKIKYKRIVNNSISDNSQLIRGDISD